MNQPERYRKKPLVPPLPSLGELKRQGQGLGEGEEDARFDKVHQSPNERDESVHSAAVC